MDRPSRGASMMAIDGNDACVSMQPIDAVFSHTKTFYDSVASPGANKLVENVTVRLVTTHGNIDLELYPGVAPKTVR